jgi:hypothetical protein
MRLGSGLYASSFSFTFREHSPHWAGERLIYEIWGPLHGTTAGAGQLSGVRSTQIREPGWLQANKAIATLGLENTA